MGRFLRQQTLDQAGLAGAQRATDDMRRYVLQHEITFGECVVH